MAAPSASRIQALLKAMEEKKASDLHLAAGTPPIYRIHGVLVSMDGEALSASDLEEMLHSILTGQQWQKFQAERELDFSTSLATGARFRGNLLYHGQAMGAVFRAIPAEPPSLDELGHPPVLKQLCRRRRGLILVTGPTGSGKSTTLAAMVDHINETEAVHVVTIEDPIEFVYKSKKALIRQREMGSDTLSFAEALRHVLRQDPEVILVGEMRDLETISLAVTAAETGHLVFGTLHTTGAAATVDRIVDVFPPHQQAQIRTQLGETLEGVISQALLPTADGKGRVCAMEIMVGTPAIRSMIREGKTHQIPSMIQTGGPFGMTTLDASLLALVKAGKVSARQAMTKAINVELFKPLVGLA